jgi:transcription elongation factor Elf1
MTETPIETVDRVLTCHTPDCGNRGHEITLTIPADVTAAACGVCGQPIEDVRTA